MSCDPRFAAYVKDAMAAIDLTPPEMEANRFMLQVADRWLEVMFDPSGQRLTFIGIVVAAKVVRADLLGQFNAYNLFHGGYSLIAPPDTGCVYLCQSHSLAGVPPAELMPRLVDFEMRAGAAGTWYLTYPAVRAEVTA